MELKKEQVKEQEERVVVVVIRIPEAVPKVVQAEGEEVAEEKVLVGKGDVLC